MVGAASLAFPGSRTLSAWRRQLAPYQPHCLWVGYLFVHFIEAQVLARCNLEVDALSRRVLQALTLMPTSLPGSRSLESRLDALLHLGVGPIAQVLRSLSEAGLIQDEAGQPALTTLGRQAMVAGHYPALVDARRVFPFVERLDPQGARLAPPHFIPLEETHEPTPWPAQKDHAFDPTWLEQCLSAPEEFKNRCHFPTSVGPRSTSSATEDGGPSWRDVLFDRTERLMVVVVLADQPEGPHWLAFSARPEGWLLQTARPVLRLPREAAAALTPLDQPPTEEGWTRSWRAWCQGRNLPAADVEACRLEPQSLRLRLTAPPKLIDRIGQAKGDLLKGDVWLMAGAGYLRAALPVDVA